MKLEHLYESMSRAEANREQAESDHMEEMRNAFKEDFTSIEDVEIYFYADDIESDMKRDGYNDAQIKPFAEITAKVGQHVDQVEESENDEVYFENEIASQLSNQVDKMQEMLEEKQDLQAALKLHEEISNATVKHATTFGAWIHSPEAEDVARDIADGKDEARDPYGHRGLSRSDFM
jgi:hypothetical protein